MDSTALFGVESQQTGGPADQPVGGLVAGGGDEVDVVERFAAGETPDVALDIGVLGSDEIGHQVVAGVLVAVVDVLLEQRALAQRAEVRADRRHVAAVGELEAVVDSVAQRDLVGVGDAQQHADGAHRDLCAEVGDDVEPAGAHERVEAASAERPDLGLDRRHPSWGEHPRHQAAVQVVGRRVLEDERARRECDVGLDDLEQRAFRRAEGAPVLEALLDVGEAAQRKEVEPLVVVERRLLA